MISISKDIERGGQNSLKGRDYQRNLESIQKHQMDILILIKIIFAVKKSTDWFKSRSDTEDIRINKL